MANNLWLPLAPAQDKKAMRSFAFGFSLLLVVFFMILIPWLFSTAMPHWPVFTAVVLSLAGFVYPPSVYPVYRVWMVIASLLAWINTRLIMLLAFYVMIFPMGVVLRALGKLQYKHVSWPRHPDAKSYWIDRHNSPQVNNLKEPF